MSILFQTTADAQNSWNSQLPCSRSPVLAPSFCSLCCFKGRTFFGDLNVDIHFNFDENIKLVIQGLRISRPPKLLSRTWSCRVAVGLYNWLYLERRQKSDLARKRARFSAKWATKWSWSHFQVYVVPHRLSHTLVTGGQTKPLNTVNINVCCVVAQSLGHMQEMAKLNHKKHCQQ